MVLCRCSCGDTTTVRESNLINNLTTRCLKCHDEKTVEKNHYRYIGNSEVFRILNHDIRKRTDHGQMKGSAGEHIAAAAFLMNGYPVYHQDHESGATDMIAEVNGEFLRCQVRCFYKGETRAKSKDFKYCSLTGSSGYRKGHKDIRGQIDLFVLVDAEKSEVFLMKPDHRKSISKGVAIATMQKIYPL